MYLPSHILGKRYRQGAHLDKTPRLKIFPSITRSTLGGPVPHTNLLSSKKLGGAIGTDRAKTPRLQTTARPHNANQGSSTGCERGWCAAQTYMYEDHSKYLLMICTPIFTPHSVLLCKLILMSHPTNYQTPSRTVINVTQ